MIKEKFEQILSTIGSNKIGQVVEELTKDAVTRRGKFERRWYDNAFFDDGYHFRMVSKSTGRIIDTLNTGRGSTERAIPRASRQIRGVSNLLFAAEPFPVVYPERITVEDFRLPNGQVDLAAYEKAYKNSKQQARKTGTWITSKWEELYLNIQLLDLILNAAKGSIAYLQVYTDDSGEICTEVLDSFDIICYGDKRELDKLPFITKATPMSLEDIKGNSMFDESMVAKLEPDNKYATSEVKDAYMRSRMGNKSDEGNAATLIVKETFMQEVIGLDNFESISKKAVKGATDGKGKGDKIMRHVFSAGGVTLLDEYIDYDCYPFAEFRFEPGYLYQTPFIERFIPQNKSVDIIMTRLEQWVNAMVVGVYQKRKGENFQVSNFAGGQMIEYEGVPLTQMNVASPGAAPFNVVNMFDKYIEEQGASTAALGQIPNDVKSGRAIESLKATEYANLKIPTLMLKKCIKKVAELMLERAHKDYIKPHEVEHMENNEPDYFNVIGKRGVELHEEMGAEIPEGTVVLDKNTKVRVEIEPGLGITTEGKRAAMSDIVTNMLEFSKQGLMSPESLKLVIQQYLETYGFGNTQELMEAMEKGGGQDMTEEQISQVKIAVLEVLKDAGAVGPESDQKLVDSTKVGVVEALKDTGMLEKSKPAKQIEIAYRDAPEDVKRQMEQLAGYIPSQKPLSTDQVIEVEKMNTDAQLEKQKIAVNSMRPKVDSNKTK